MVAETTERTEGQQPLLTLKEAAERLRVSEATLREMVERKAIAFIDLNRGRKDVVRRNLRFRPEQIDEYLARQTVASASKKRGSRKRRDVPSRFFGEQ